jgi:hypothetical protein
MENSLVFLGSLGFLSAFCFFIGTYCYHYSLQSDFFNEFTYPGYELDQWMALAAGTLLLPLAICFSLIFTIQFFKSKFSNLLKLIIFYCLFGFSIWGIYESYNYSAGEILICGVFCFGASEEAKENAINGGKVVIGRYNYIQII